MAEKTINGKIKNVLEETTLDIFSFTVAISLYSYCYIVSRPKNTFLYKILEVVNYLS